jgi:hypothetical protein
MFLHVTDAKYLEGYKIEVSFNDGKKGVADLLPALHGPVFEPLKDPSLFAQVRVDQDLETLVWPNGADLAPEYIYFCAFWDNPELQEKFRAWGYLSSE